MPYQVSEYDLKIADAAFQKIKDHNLTGADGILSAVDNPMRLQTPKFVSESAAVDSG
jgi:hypothetical protein